MCGTYEAGTRGSGGCAIKPGTAPEVQIDSRVFERLRALQIRACVRHRHEPEVLCSSRQVLEGEEFNAAAAGKDWQIGVQHEQAQRPPSHAAGRPHVVRPRASREGWATTD